MAALRILVTGASGFLGGFAVAAVEAAGHAPCTVSRRAGHAALDLTAPGAVAAVVEALRPDLVLHLAALSSLAACAADPERARRVNVGVAAELVARFGARVLLASTDLVFDGRSAPYDEFAAPSPLSDYGASKAEAERVVLRGGGRVVRLPLLFGAEAAGRGASAAVRKAVAAGTPSSWFTNEYRTPLHAADAAEALLEVLVDVDGPNLLHLPGPERVSRWQFARRLCRLHGLDDRSLVAVECEDATRPRDVSLAGAWRARRPLDEMLVNA